MISNEIVIKKQLKTIRGSIIDFEIYEGYSNSEDLINFLKEHRINLKYVAIVRFLDMYYAVIFKSFTEELMIGKDYYWYRERYLTIRNKTSSFYNPYDDIDEIKKISNMNQIVYYDLLEIDPNIDIYFVKNNNLNSIHNYRYAKSYAVLLGVTFYATFYTKKNWMNEMQIYFNTSHIVKNLFNTNEKGVKVEGVNIFRCEQLLSDGRIVKKSFYSASPKRHI